MENNNKKDRGGSPLSFLYPVNIIVGSKKNAGKTTVLNYLLTSIEKLSNKKTIITSIGWDGEKEDRFFGNKKPPVKIFPGLYIITAEFALKKIKIEYKVWEELPFKSILGKFYIIETLSYGNIELIGAENNEYMRKIINISKKRINPDYIIIDGALDRVTQISKFKNAGIILVFKIENNISNVSELKRAFKKFFLRFTLKEFKNKNKILDKTNISGELFYFDNNFNLLSINSKSSTYIPKNSKYVYVNGALTDNIYKKIKEKVVIIKDASFLFLNNFYDTLPYILEKKIISAIFIYPNNILNSTISKKIIMEETLKYGFNIKIFDAMNINH